MATAIFRRSPARARMAVAGWISGGTAILLTALLGAANAAQIRLAAALLGEAWFGPSVRAWLR
ncbi:MAG: hypothetical protein JF628_08095 [Sphingomonas sp.]|jgi:hypothetical protein|nr:hypothetical protein [Sphingomonas sp.]